MNIAVIDDEKPVREYYEDICLAGGHSVECFADLPEGVAYVGSHFCDVVFLDNHFARPNRAKALYGVDSLPELRIARPHCFVVLMSSKQFSTDMVKAAVEHKVEFFIENPPNAGDIQETLRRISLIREREALVVRDVLRGLGDSLEAQESLFARIMSALQSGKKPTFDFAVEYLGKSHEEILLSPMKRVSHVARGDKVIFESTVSATRGGEFRADSKYGIGLTLGESKSLLSTVLGTKIQSKVEESTGIRLDESVSRTYSQRLEIALHDADIASGAYTKDVFEGLVYERHIVAVSIRHSRSGLEQRCELSCFVPLHFETAVCLKNELGVPIRDERQRFTIWNLAKQVLEEIGSRTPPPRLSR